MEASKNADTKKKLRSAAIKAAGTVTAAGMLLNGTVDAEDLLTSPEQKAQTAGTAHVQHGSAPVYTVKGTKLEQAPAPTKAELIREKIVSLHPATALRFSSASITHAVSTSDAFQKAEHVA